MEWTLGSILPAAAKRFGTKTALIFKDRSLSFAELDQLANRLAAGLQALGVGPGDKVTLYSVNRWEWVVSYYAIHQVGAVAIPINVMLTAEEVAYVANDSGSRIVLASADKGAALQTVRAHCPIEHIVLFGADDEVPGTQRFEALLDHQSPYIPVAADPDALSTIAYTSGTTGHPKGAMLSHRAILASSAGMALMHVRTEHDTGVTALPCSHVYGNVTLNGAILYGMTLVIIQKFNEEEVLNAIQTYQATILDGVPTMYMYLLAYPDLHKYTLSSLKRCAVGGQTMPVAKARAVEEAFGCPMLEVWGMTELGGVATTNPFYGENRHGSIGLGEPGMTFRIADPEDASVTLAPGEVGELMARGTMVMQGYYGNEKATRDTIEPDGWLHTGDLGKMDDAGYIYIVDRKKDLIITGGFNVYPAELERVVSGHPAVAMVGVGPKQDELKGEVAKAYVVLNPGASATADEILAYCREHLAAYKVPRSVQFVADLPKTSSGKIMRRELKTLDT